MTGSNPTDRSKLGTKRHILTIDKDGIPLSTIITSANTHHDVTVAIDTVDSIVIKRSPLPSSRTKYRNKKKQRSRIYTLIKHIIPKKWNKKLSKGIRPFKIFYSST